MNTEAPRHSVTAVVIDDNEAHLDLMCKLLEHASGPERHIIVHPYSNADVALAELPAMGTVVVLCDYQLGGASGIDWIPDFLRTNVGPVIIITSSGDERIAAEAFRQGASDYVDKATIFEQPAQLLKAIDESLRRFKLEQTNRELAKKLKLANGELHRKNVTLAQLTDTAHRFVDDVAHEFRTPLSVIMEFASIISDGIGGEVTTKQSEYLGFISDASHDLANLIDDFLDSGKLRARTLRVERQRHSVAALTQSCHAILSTRAASKGITLECEIDPELPDVFADAEKVRRTLVNLVINAIKFSDPGSIVRLRAKDAGDGTVRVEVVDKGPGIPQDAADALFHRFRQGANPERIASKGFGLGLNIAKELVAINLGTMGVESVVGEGSTFFFSLPQAHTEHIVDAFVTRMQERAPGCVLSALSVRRGGWGSDLQDLRSFVASVCHATDIQLDGPDGQSLIIVGDTIEPAGWRNRIVSLDTPNGPSGGSPPGELFVEELGAWPVDDAKAAILGIVQPQACATP